MATYVLIHGAMTGGWVMRGIADGLREQGHLVYTPTLTGLGERSHLLTPEVDLHTHITDVVNVLTYEDLHDVILLGKSYSGIVVTGVIEQIPERVKHLVYLDAIVPESGQPFLETATPRMQQAMTGFVNEWGDGWRLPANQSDNPRLSDHPFSTFKQALTLDNPDAARIPRTYIYCPEEGEFETHHARLTQKAAERAQHEGWGYYELDAGHDVEQKDPASVVEILLDLA